MFGGDGAWDFHERLLTDYDGVVKVHGILNVCSTLPIGHHTNTNNPRRSIGSPIVHLGSCRAASCH